jgi:DNA-directed RNA polymerase specialized sigma24 family protein
MPRAVKTQSPGRLHMSGDRELKQEALDELLNWLDPDRERAASKYEIVRRALIIFFTNRGCAAAEDLADETINRVALKARELQEKFVGEPGKFFHGVARNVHLEHMRSQQKFVPLHDNLSAIAGPGPYDETVYECLERCLQALDPAQSELVRRYYHETRAAQRETLAKELGTNVGNLRVRVFRLVKHLYACVKKCVGRGG